MRNICERLLLNLKNAPEKFSNCFSFTKVNIDQTCNFSDFRKSMPVRISVFPGKQTTCVSTGLKYLVNNQSLLILSLLNNEVFRVRFPSFYNYRLFFMKQQFCWLSAVKSRWYRYSTYGSTPFFIEISSYLKTPTILSNGTLSPSWYFVETQNIWFWSKLSYSKRVFRRCSTKSCFVKYSQSSHENTCVGVSFLCEAASYLQL